MSTQPQDESFARPTSERRFRRVVRDYVLDYMEDHPNATKEEVMAGVSDQLKADFGSTEWVTLLLQILELLLPVILKLLKK